MPEKCRLEQKRVKHTHTLLAPASDDKSVKIGNLMMCEDISSKTRLLRVTVQVLKCSRIWTHKIRSSDSEFTQHITSQDMQEAETHWIKEMQISLVRNTKIVAWQQQFGLFIDNAGVWCCGGQLTKTDLPFMTLHPVLLDSQHPLPGLIVLDAHATVKHNGISENLAEIWSRYWIECGRSLVKMILRRYVICRRFEGQANYPSPPPLLPSFRVREAPVFIYIGVDYSGTLYIKRVGRLESTKVSICLFTVVWWYEQYTWKLSQI